MAQVSQQIDARARKNLTVLLRAIGNVSQVRMAERLGVDESTVSRMKSSEFERIASVVAACGLKLVPEEQEVYEPGYLEKLRDVLSVELSRKLPVSGFGDL